MKKKHSMHYKNIDTIRTMTLANTRNYHSDYLHRPKTCITPQPLYDTIVGVQDNFRVNYPIRVITRVKCIDL